MNTEKNPSSIERFCQAIRIDTSWPATADHDPKDQRLAEEALSRFQEFLVSAYPHFHSVAERTILSPYSILYRWQGKQKPANTTKPVLFLAHYDVVPVDKESWTADPFGAEIRDNYIYGRGTLDTKNTLICAMEAAETLAAKGYTPDRDIWFAFGGDEERSGAYGAQQSAAWFTERNLRFAWTLDEGSIVALNQIPGVSKPLALIGVEEKGFLDIELVVQQAPGHASRPPEKQAVAILSEALVRLSKKPFPYRLIPSVEFFFTSLAPLVDKKSAKEGLQALVLAHPRQLGPLFFSLAGISPATRALFRTTLAMTQLFGAKADNILPAEARAILNLRLLPGDSIESALEYVRDAIGMDEVLVRPSPYRSANNPVLADRETAAGRGPGWENLVQALSSTFPQAVPLPFLVTATTDSRHYASLCQAVYRFGPLELPPEEVNRIHGHDERISLENLQRGIAFYERLFDQL
jgi:carboxypeptidase PM20D1